LGLGHSTEPEATMYPYYSGGTAGRQLSDDDRTGVCVLYPAGAKGCTTSAECPPNTRCVDGRCQEGYDGAVCSPCTDHEQCGGAEDLCLRYPDGTARCARACTADGDCEAVPGCAERSCRCHDLGGDQGAQCVADDMTCIGGATCDTDDDCPNDQQCDGGNCIPKGCAALADQCDSADDCCSGLCVEGQCTQPCDWLTPNLGCPASFYCDIRECGTALCMPGKLGPAAAGESCLRHAECSTGYCASTGGPSTCQWPCEPEGRSACPESWSCLQIGASECGLCACHMGRLGDPCDGDNSCASGFCAGKSGQRRCTRGCHETNPCPEGYDCLDAGDSSICWPRQGGFDAACLNDNDCPAGSCRDGACTRVCQSDCDCPADYECPDDEGHCQRPPATGGCACQSTGPAPLAPTGAFLLLGAWLLWRSRRTGVEPRPGAR
jgi:MYXO-CTERM domain-containing protein